MNDDHRVSFSIDGAFGAITSIFRFLGDRIHPITRFLNSVSDAGWIGTAIIFMLFFMLYLARKALRSGRPVEYGEILVYIGYRGLIFCGIYFALLAVEYVVMPPLVILATCLINTFTGGEPGLFQMIGFLSGGSDARAEYLGDVAQFYGTSHSLLPLGVRAFGFVAIAVFSLWSVGLALSNLRRVDH